ncbi:DUF58 domain-containing protein [Deltaproteobacteria bacterium TL4]
MFSFRRKNKNARSSLQNAEVLSLWRPKQFKVFVSSMNRGLRFTKVGFWFTVISTLLGIGAMNTGINTLFISVGIFLNVMILSGWVSERIMRYLQLQLEPLGIAVSGEPVIMKAHASNRSSFLPLIGVELSNEEWDFFKIVPFVRPAETEEVWITLKPQKRGIYHELQVECLTRFPFGLFEKYKYVACHYQQFVAPERQRLSPDILNRIGRYEDQERDSKGEHEFYQLKTYQHGDPVNHIHWKKTASAQEVILNEFNQPITHGIYHFYCDPRKALTEAAYEHFLSMVFSLMAILHENQHLFEVWTPEGQCLRSYAEIGKWLAGLPAFEDRFNMRSPLEFIPVQRLIPLDELLTSVNTAS